MTAKQVKSSKPVTRFVVDGVVVGTLKSTSERRIKEHAHFYAHENIGKQVFIVRQGDTRMAQEAGVTA